MRYQRHHLSHAVFVKLPYQLQHLLWFASDGVEDAVAAPLSLDASCNIVASVYRHEG